MSSELAAALCGGLIGGGFSLSAVVVTSMFKLKRDSLAAAREDARWLRENLFPALTDAARYVKLIEARLDSYQTDPRIVDPQPFLEPGDATAIWGRLSALNGPAGAALHGVMFADILVQEAIQTGDHYVKLGATPVRQPDGSWKPEWHYGVFLDGDDECAKRLRDAISRFFATADTLLPYIHPR